MNWYYFGLLLISMLFCHLVDDYYLQGMLAQLKQRQWWKENAPAHLYRNDYKIALIEHAFSWSVVMSAPLVILAVINDNAKLMILMLGMYIVNTAVHAIIDNWKANQHKINLVEDQCMHFFQILFTWGISLFYL